MKYFVFLLVLLGLQPAIASVNLVDKDDWKVDMSGFVESDLIYDTTRSFTENIGNNPVKPTNGTKGQTQMSIRNSRLGFNVQAPTWDDYKSRGYFEFDFLGYDPNTPTQSEASLFDNPTLRVRHAYIQTEKDGWTALTGQTWDLMGWQPYYFMPTLEVSPIPGMLYSRTPQLRGMKTIESGASTWQFAAGIMRPPQRIANLPAFEAGARWAMNSDRAAYTGGAAGSNAPQPLSVGWSGTVRDLEVNNSATSPSTSSKTGYAMSLDFLVPIISSPDGKSTSNNLVIGGEYTIGQGYGDEFGSWTGDLPNPLNSSTTNPYNNNPMDAGIAGYEDTGFALIRLQSLNLYAQYHLPESWRSWVSAGYSQLYSPNMGAMNMTVTGGIPNTEAYNKEQAMFVNVAHDCTKQIRVGFEYAQIKTWYVNTYPYLGAAGTSPIDNRFQFSTWFIF